MMESTLPREILEPALCYLELLDRWNRTHALTALAKEDRFEELILDSAVVLPFLRELQPGSRVVDFGTGMGVPAVLVALARPDLNVIALDKSNKKIAFVRQAGMELGLANLRPSVARAEQAAPLAAHAGLAKAVGTLELLAGWWTRHGLPGAPLLALKGPEGAQEAPPPGFQVQAYPYALPRRGRRTLLELRRISG
jgi:16S rRNA (guanine527-N7)-methyltransferase